MITKKMLMRVPLELLVEVVAELKQSRRKALARYGKQALKIVLYTCPGCKKEMSATEIRKHKCKKKLSYWKKMGKVYSAKHKKYVWPEDK